MVWRGVVWCGVRESMIEEKMEIDGKRSRSNQKQKCENLKATLASLSGRTPGPDLVGGDWPSPLLAGWTELQGRSGIGGDETGGLNQGMKQTDSIMACTPFIMIVKP